MRFAVTSKSGTEVDQHFGHATRFLIYDYAKGQCRRVDAVEVEKYCSFDPDHPFRQTQFNAITEAIKGCQAVVTAMIGDLPRQALKAKGIETITVEGPIEEALHGAHQALCGCACNKSECSKK